MFPQAKLDEIWDELNQDKSVPDHQLHEEFLKTLMIEFGWTKQQAYITTDHMFRPDGGYLHRGN